MDSISPLGLDDMGVFLAVVEAGSLTTAAKRLGMRKSTVSRRLSAMEERLGAMLLHRTTRQLRLTDAGERYRVRCARVVAEARAAEEELRKDGGVPRGTLRVSATPPLADMLLPAVLFPYLARYPGMEAEVITTMTVVDLVAQGIDVAIRVGPLADSSLNARRLGSAHIAYCASPAYVRAHGAPRTPRELEAHSCVAIADSKERAQWPFRGPRGRTVRLPVTGRLRGNDFALAREAVLAGLGIGRFPRAMVARDVAEGRLVEVLTEHLPPTFPIYAVYPGSRRAQPKVQAFLELLTAYLQSNPQALHEPRSAPRAAPSW